MRALSCAVLLLLCPAAAGAATQVRVATWNVEAVGDPVSAQYLAALSILDRIGADVVAINEVFSDADTVNFEMLALDAGYSHTVVSGPTSFDFLRNGVMSRFPIISQTVHTSTSLSGDPSANDITRLVVEVELDLPEPTVDLTLLVQHWKSGTTDEDEFRRAVESRRISQALAPQSPTDDAYIVVGDLNEEIDSVPRVPNPFTSLPAGLPASFVLGADLAAQLAAVGIPNDPFFLLDSVFELPALQLDGSDTTRPSSGRRLDYIFVSPVLVGSAMAEVYDSLDEGLGGGLPKFGSPLPPGTSADASDHHLVCADMTVPSGPVQVPVVSGWLPLLIAMALMGAAAAVPARRGAPNQQ